MKLAKILPILIAAGLVWLAWPGAAKAQSPTDQCITGTTATTNTLSHDFSDDAYSDWWTIATQSQAQPYWTETFGCSGDPLLGVYTPGNGYNSIACGAERNIAIRSDFTVSSPITGTRSQVRLTGPYPFNTNTRLQLRCFNANDDVVLDQSLSSTGTWYNIPNGETCTIWVVERDLNSKLFAGFDVSCATGIYPEPPDPGGGLICPLVTNANFSDADPWLLSGGAAIGTGELSLPSGGIAAQNLSTLQSNTDYTATISVTQVLSGSAFVDVVLGTDSQTVEIDATGVYTTSFTTPTIGGSLAYGLQNTGPGDLTITYTCLNAAGGDEETRDCIAPDNGEFTSAADWFYGNGASWSSTSQAAIIPYNDPDQYSDPWYTPAFISNDTIITLPTVITGEYILLAFDARSQTGQNGLIDNLVQNAAQTIDHTLIAEVFPVMYTFEQDISDMEGEPFEVLFGNDGGYPTVTHTAPVMVDNVCVFVSDRGPNLPAPTDPDAIDPVNLGEFYSCDDVESILAGWGVDVRYWRDIYDQGVSVWDPVNWVPWLVSAWWNMVEIYLCSIIVFIATVINIAEYLLNNGLNVAFWFKRNAEAAIPWALSWLFSYGWQSILNFFDAAWITSGGWLLWLGAILLFFGGVPGSILGQIAVLVYLWLWGSAQWLADWVFASFGWILGGVSNVATWLINSGLAPLWNGLITAVEYLFSAAVEAMVYVWNEGLFPFIQLGWQYLAFIFLLGALPAIAMFLAFWSLFWAVIMWLWENVIQMVTLPISFYTGLQAGVNSTAFSDLLSCSGSTTDFWCGYLSALDLVNNIAGHSIFYPIVIIGITFGTVAILWRQINGLWNIISDLIIRI